MTSSSPSILQTACPLDCPDTCSLDVRIEDGRVTKLDGNRRNPVTGGYICSKVRRYTDYIYGQERLTSPMRRIGAKGEGQFETVSWDEALDEIAERFGRIRDEHGGEGILPFSYGGSNGVLTQDTLDARFFRRLGASQLARTVCAAATTAALVGLYGKMPGVAYEDYPEAKLIVVWGANPSASGIHLVPYILEAKKKGAKLVVVDPRRTPLAKQADLHLPLRPGTDLALALAIIDWLFTHDQADLTFLSRHTTGSEELRQRAADWTISSAAEVCGLEASTIAAFARLYAESSPALIRCGWGQERNRNGGSATAAILALPAIAGKFGVRGGGYTASNSGAFPIDPEAVIQEPPSQTRTLNMNRLGRQLLSEQPPIHGLFVYNANPVATLPRQDLVCRGLERADLFTVVFEQTMTDTARFADILLPATTFLEHHDLRKPYGAYAFQAVQPTIDPVGDARSNPVVFEALIEKLGLARTGDISAADLSKELIQRDGLSPEQQDQLRAHGLCEPKFGRQPIQMVDIRPHTADGKIHLVPRELEEQAEGGLYRYRSDPRTEERPLSLISPATNKTISASLGHLRKDRVALDLHPQDATSRGLVSGDSIRAWNEFGEVHCSVRVTTDVRPGVASLPKGLWQRHTLNGATSNALVPDSYTDLGDGACFNDARIEVAKV